MTTLVVLLFALGTVLPFSIYVACFAFSRKIIPFRTIKALGSILIRVLIGCLMALGIHSADIPNEAKALRSFRFLSAASETSMRRNNQLYGEFCEMINEEISIN